MSRPSLSIFEALGKLSLGGPPIGNYTHTCTLFTMPSAGPYNLHLYACCANYMGLHDIATLATHGCIAAVFAALILSYLAVLMCLCNKV